MIELIINIVFGLLALTSVVWGAFVLKKLVGLVRLYKSSDVTVPLYPRFKWHIPILVLLGAALIADIVYLILSPSDYIIAVSLMVIIGMIAAVVGLMMKVKCGVTDSGVIMPYRFISWDKLGDYRIDGDSVFFMGNAAGFDTMEAATAKLGVVGTDIEKLSKVLEEHKKH